MASESFDTTLVLEFVDRSGQLGEVRRSEAVRVYQEAFAALPYEEIYTNSEAEDALDTVLAKGGVVVLAIDNDSVVALAAGFPGSAGSFFIEELAVSPRLQGRGFGRAALRGLLSTDLARNADYLELCTAADNDRAIHLYESEGFVVSPVREAAPHVRNGDTIAVYERVRLSTVPAAKENGFQRVAVAFPSGNTTAIVFDQLLDADRGSMNATLTAAIARDLPQIPEVEQCCFITFPDNPAAIARMEMFGGEFCGNAVRSVVWLVAGGADSAGFVEASGTTGLLAYRVQDGIVEVEMPLPRQGDLVELVAEGVLVRLDGIVHLVSLEPATQASLEPRALLHALLSKNSYGLRDQPAVGVSYYDPRSRTARFCVWVREVDTMFDETACGSGTSAIGIALASRSGQGGSVAVVQPSSEEIRVDTTLDDGGAIVRSAIAGAVEILYDGEIRL